MFEGYVTRYNLAIFNQVIISINNYVCVRHSPYFSHCKHKLLVKYLLISVGVMKVWAIPLLQRIIDCGWTNHSPDLRHVT